MDHQSISKLIMPPELNRLAEDILLELRRIMRSMDIASRQLIGERGLTIPQLLCLQRLQEQGAMTSGMLAQAVALSPATVTGILDRLELRGLVTRERRPEDKRRVLVAVTETGAAAADTAPSRLATRLSKALKNLSEDERNKVLSVIHYLADVADSPDNLP